MKVIDAQWFQLEAPSLLQNMLTNRFVIPDLLPDLQMRIVAEMLQDFPAGLALHFLDVLLHERLECLKVNTLDVGVLVLRVGNHDLLQGGDMLTAQLLIKDGLLKVDQVLIVHVAIAILVADSKDSPQCFHIIWLQLPLYGVV